MDEQRNEVEKVEETMLPGFRFHPTDEELVGFYLKRKIQQKPLPFELIKQLDIYKHDPWDLPKLASTGEKEWYFYCPRDRKYRNSARPNRVTGAGFWKATGTDRPIYSSEGNKCIGLKKSLVFYKGRAAKGIKTDWMMHEFRLPCVADLAPAKRFMDKSTLANDSWAICRIFKKTNSTAQRALSQSWVVSPPLPEPSSTTTSDHLLEKSSLTTAHHHFTPPQNHFSLMTEASTTSPSHLDYPTSDLHSSTTISHDHDFSTLDHFPSFRTTLNPMQVPEPPPPPHQLTGISSSTADLTSTLFFSPLDALAPPRCTVDMSSVLLNMSSSPSSVVLDGFSDKVTERIDDFGGPQHLIHSSGFPPFTSPASQAMQVNVSNGGQWETTSPSGGVHSSSSVGFPFGLPVSSGAHHTWRPNLLWDSSSLLPSEVSSSFSTNKCYT